MFATPLNLLNDYLLLGNDMLPAVQAISKDCFGLVVVCADCERPSDWLSKQSLGVLIMQVGISVLQWQRF